MNSVTEVWRVVTGFESYEASSFGSVRSVDRFVQSGRGAPGVMVRRKGRPIKGTLHKGYLVVGLSAMVDGRAVMKYVGVHQAVARAFHGNPNGLVVDHIDGDKLNNKPENLEYVTRSESVKRSYKNGLLTNQAGKVGRWKSHTKKSA